MTPADSFRTRLVELGDKSGLTGRELAAWVGVPRSTMRYWLRGGSPHDHTLRAAARALDYLDRELKRQRPRLPLSITVSQRDRLANVQRLRSLYSR